MFRSMIARATSGAGLAVWVLALSACGGGGGDGDSGGGTTPPATDYAMTATVYPPVGSPTPLGFNDQLHCSRTLNNGRVESFKISGTGAASAGSVPSLEIQVQAPGGNIGVGAYQEGSAQVTGKYTVTTGSSSVVYDSATASETDFTVTLSKISSNSTTVQGSFKGKLKSAASGETMEVNGTFFALCEGTSQPVQGPGAEVEDFVGDWVQNFCGPTGTGQWGRLRIQVAKSGTDQASYSQGLVVYGTNTCDGPGVPYGISTSMGTVTFDPGVKSTATLSARWGLWTYVAGSTRIIWAKNGVDMICIVGDETPTHWPTAADVEAYVNLGTFACYNRRPTQ